MTKKKGRNQKIQRAEVEKKGRILASSHLTVPTSTSPREIDRRDRITTPWVLFYRDSLNAFPNNLADQILKSGTNSGIINSKRTLTVGDGLRYTKDGEDFQLTGDDLDFVESINPQDDSLEELYNDVAFDFIGWGASYVRGIRDTENNIHLDHIDVTKVRLSPRNAEGIIETAFISPDWVRIGNKRSADKEQKRRMATIPIFDASKKQKEFIFILKRNFPGLDYYGVPDYMGAVLSGWVDINYRIGRFNIDDLDNGLMPSALIQFFGEPPEGMSPKQYIQAMKDNFTGQGKNGKMLFQFLEESGQAANVQLFEGVKQGHFEILDKMADQSLVTAHGWYRSLTGLAEPGSLGSNQQILNEFDLAMNMKVIPDYRRPINRFFNRMLKIAEKDFQVAVINLEPLSLSNRIDANKCLTVDEGREILGRPPHKDKEIGKQLIDLEDREDDDATTSNGSRRGNN